MAADPRKWLLLIHQIPPKPNAFRVKIWRRLQQVGAVAIKPSVYALPVSDEFREDFSWVRREILGGGGDCSIMEAGFIEGLTDDQVIALFRADRKADYDKIIQEAGQLLAQWSSEFNASQGQVVKNHAQVSKLQRRLNEIIYIDFFRAPERGTAEILLMDLSKQLSADGRALTSPAHSHENLQGKTWVTRRNIFVDRMACGWLIRRFIDPEAVFKFVKGSRYIGGADEICFDMFEGEFTHHGDQCSFEVIIGKLGLLDQALTPISEIVHDIDLKESRFGRHETDGVAALLTGLAASCPDDDRRMGEGFHLFDGLYAYFQRFKG